MMIGVRLVAGSRRKRRHNSIPLIPGNIRSRMMSRGGSRSFNAARVRLRRSARHSHQSFTLKVVLQTLGDVGVILDDQDWAGHDLVTMLDESSLGHVDGQFTNVGHVVADAFEMFGDKQAVAHRALQ
jgi:hypothetical protein